jgi:phosphopantothenoylcysteine synthetase/decarboxylase
MPSFGSPTGDVLYLIACAAPPAAHLAPVITTAQDDGWDVCVVATPPALAWLDLEALSDITGHPVRSEFRQPTEPEFSPLGDAVLLSPASFNTINKWAAGINDTLALGLLNEAIGRSVPVVVLPWVNDALATHPAYQRSIDVLTQASVTFVTPATERDPATMARTVRPYVRGLRVDATHPHSRFRSA